MVEVFKTNITSEHKAEETLLFLKSQFPDYKANFDLEDCDNILRIESKNGHLKTDEIIFYLSKINILVEVLND